MYNILNMIIAGYHYHWLSCMFKKTLINSFCVTSALVHAILVKTNLETAVTEIEERERLIVCGEKKGERWKK